MALNGTSMTGITTSASIHAPPATPVNPPAVPMELDDGDIVEGVPVDDDTSEHEDNADRPQDRGIDLI